MRRFELKEGEFVFSTGVLGFYEKRITRFGNGAKIDAPKRFIGHRVIVLVLED